MKEVIRDGHIRDLEQQGGRRKKLSHLPTGIRIRQNAPALRPTRLRSSSAVCPPEKSGYIVPITPWNSCILENLYMVLGDEQLEMQASRVSGAASLTAGNKQIAGRTIVVNQSQLDKQVPNIRDLVRNIE